MSYLKGIGVIILFIVLCLILMMTVSRFVPGGYSSVLLARLFVLMNIGFQKAYKLNKQVYDYWMVSSKTPLLFITAIIIGILIGLFPEIVCWGTYGFSIENIRIVKEISVMGIVNTLFVVLWEELWFRGLVLNYGKKFGEILMAICMGSLFMLLHLFNPEIHLLIDGSSLFLAGAFLSMTYYNYQTIWVPVGLHFGNNYFGGFIDVESDWGVYTSVFEALILFFAFIYQVFIFKRNGKSISY